MGDEINYGSFHKLLFFLLYGELMIFPFIFEECLSILTSFYPNELFLEFLVADSESGH